MLERKVNSTLKSYLQLNEEGHGNHLDTKALQLLVK